MPKNRVTKGKDGRYFYSVTDLTGKRHQIRSRKTETRKEFSLRCNALDQKTESGMTNILFNELFFLWLENYVKLNLSESDYLNSKITYKNHVKQYLGLKDITEISRADVYQVLSYAKANGYKASHIKKIRSCISRPYNWAINSLGFKISSPTDGLIFSYNDQHASKTKIISDDDMDRFLKAAENSSYFHYFNILNLTGLRPSECLGLKIQDIKPDVLEIKRGITIHGLSKLKTKNAVRDIPLTTKLNKILSLQKNKVEHITKTGWLFPSQNGTPSMNALRLAFKKIKAQTAVWERGGRNGLKKIKLITPAVNFNLYDFRHTFATKCAESNMNHTALMKLMGHSSITTTLKYYIDLTDEMKKQALKILDTF